MIEGNNLKYLINEEIFIIDDKNYPSIGTTPQQVEESKPQFIKTEETRPAIQTDEKTTVVELAVWTAPLTADDQTLLEKMLTAVAIDFKDISLLNGSDGYNHNYRKLLCFGFQEELSKKINKDISIYEPTQVEGRNILCAPPLSVLHNNQDEKRKLWTALQKFFLN